MSDHYVITVNPSRLSLTISNYQGTARLNMTTQEAVGLAQRLLTAVNQAVPGDTVYWIEATE